MAQAKSLTPAELEHLLEFVSQRTYAMRNRLILAFGFHAGMRVGEISSLTVADVMNPDGRVKTEVRSQQIKPRGVTPALCSCPSGCKRSCKSTWTYASPPILLIPFSSQQADVHSVPMY
jgi:integrase